MCIIILKLSLKNKNKISQLLYNIFCGVFVREISVFDRLIFNVLILIYISNQAKEKSEGRKDILLTIR